MTGDRPLDLLVVGDANPDVVLSGVPEAIAYAQVEQLVDTGTLTVGGSAAILACGAARLGLRTALVSIVGDDGAGRFMLEQLRRRDVDVSGVHVGEDLATGLTVHLIKDEQGGRAMLTFPGCITALDDQMVPPELLRSARHVHVSSFFLQPLLGAGLGGLFMAAHEAGAAARSTPIGIRPIAGRGWHRCCPSPTWCSPTARRLWPSPTRSRPMTHRAMSRERLGHWPRSGRCPS